MQIKVQNSGERLDKYLSANREFSRSLIIKMIKDNCILVNGIKERPSYLVCENDVIDIDPYVEELAIKGEDIPIDIVYEDEYLMVVNKPSGLVVHPSPGHKSGTLVNALIYYQKTLSDVDNHRPGIVHRLDKDTSGLMLVAKNNKVHEILADDFKHKRIKREYIALVDGVIPHEKATIDAPIGRDSKNIEVMAVQGKNSKEAKTHLKVLKRYQDKTLISLNLETGRTHQIRVHMKYIGHPVFNDPVYNKKTHTEFGQFLHSTKIDFIHPITKENLTFEIPVPKEFQDYLDNLESL